MSVNHTDEAVRYFVAIHWRAGRKNGVGWAVATASML